MSRVGVAVVVAVVGVLGVASVISRAEAAQETEYAYGTITSIAPDHLVVREYNYETGIDEDLTYAVDPKIELINAKALSDIAVGNEVSIDYVAREGINVAVAIERELPEAETAEPSGTPEAPATATSPTERTPY